MIERLNASPAAAYRGTHVWPMAYAGPERRAAQGALGTCLTRMLDEIDYGMLLVSTDAQVAYFNHAARRELDGEHPLQLMAGTLRAKHAQDVSPLYDALQSARQGKRKLVTLGQGVHRVSLSVVPLSQAYSQGAGQRGEDADALTLLMLSKRQVCEQLSVEGFARNMGLTPAETRVLQQLCAGVRPTVIAREQGVAVSTVRTQIGSIRLRTGASSISELVRQVAVLPPMMGALRGGGLMPGL